MACEDLLLHNKALCVGPATSLHVVFARPQPFAPAWTIPAMIKMPIKINLALTKGGGTEKKKKKKKVALLWQYPNLGPLSGFRLTASFAPMVNQPLVAHRRYSESSVHRRKIAIHQTTSNSRSNEFQFTEHL